MFKKTVAMVLSLTVLLCQFTFFSSYAEGEENSYPGYKMEITEASDAAISNPDFVISDGILTAYNGGGGEITIPEGVVEIGDSVFSGNKTITKINFNQGLKKIGNRSFQSSTIAGALALPESLETLGTYAFNSCRSITSLKLNDGLKIIGDDAFSDCTYLGGSLIIPDTVTTIGARAFYLDTLFTGDLIIPDSVTEVGMQAFMSCSGLNGKLVISENLKKLSSYIFARCTRLTGTVAIPDSVTEIGSYFFYNMSGIRHIVVGKGLQDTTTYDGFAGCSGVETVTFTRTDPPKIGFGGFDVFANIKAIYVPKDSYDAYVAKFAKYVPVGVFLLREGEKIPDIYGVNVSQTGTYVFPSETQGYNDAPVQTITVANVGNVPSGALRVALSGNIGSFVLSTGTLDSIDVSATKNFTISPRLGLQTGTYGATVTISGDNGITASFGVRFTVNAPAQTEYIIESSILGTYTFNSLSQGYEAPRIVSKEIQIANLGSRSTGVLNISISGSGANAFNISDATLADMPSHTISVFSIEPKLGLIQGTYEAKVTVSGGNNISTSFNVSFTVNQPPQNKISVDTIEGFTFSMLREGYSAGEVLAKNVTITNVGPLPSGVLFVILTGSNANAFTLSTNYLPSINNVGGKSSFSVAPKTSLAMGRYTATVTISGEGEIFEQFPVMIEIGPPLKYGLTLDVTGTYNFSTLTVGYNTVSAKTVTATNIGDLTTGTLSLALSGANASSFMLSSNSISGIIPGGNGSFTVAPRTGLAAGVYSAVVTISGANVSASFNVTLTVQAGITLSIPNPYALPSLEANYASSAIQSRAVEVRNIGTSATGSLNVSLTGKNPGAFVLSARTLSSINANAVRSFNISAATGLSDGTYEALLTVSNTGTLSASSLITLTVTPYVYRYTISLNTDPHTFTTQTIGYASSNLTAKSVTVTNTGNQATGALTVRLAGTNPNNFTLSATSLSTIAVGSNRSFTVIPKTGLAAGTYSASVTVSGANNINASFPVYFTVAPRTYAVSLDTTGTYVFPAQVLGYTSSNLSARSVQVTNSGNQATGALRAALSGANAGSFTLSATSLSTIAVGASRSFTVVPKTGLAAGTYTATVTVSGSNGISASFAVSFTVNSGTYKITLDSTGTHVFPGQAPGYTSSNLTAKSVQATNSGNQATGTLSVALSGANAGSFTLSATSLSTIAVGASRSFTVTPKTGLAAGTYTATVTVSGSNGINANFAVSFTVSPGFYKMSLDTVGTHIFAAQVAGYTSANLSGKSVQVSNLGNQATGTLTVALSGTHPSSFALSATSLATIAPGTSKSFTVTPKTGLVAGTYNATVTVSGANNLKESFDVSIKISPKTYGISLDTIGTYTFPAQTVGYTTANLSAKTATVKNTGNQSSGALSLVLSGTNASSFTISASSLPALAAGENSSFTIVPKTGLPAGVYTATVTLTGVNSISARLMVSFQVL